MRRDSGHGWRTAAMRRPRMVTMRITLLIAVALAAHASGDERPTLRAAEAGVSPGFCPALRALVDEAPGGLTALRGAARRGGEHIMWEGSRRLPGASDCVVFGGTPPAYACTLYAGDAEERAYGARRGAAAGEAVARAGRAPGPPPHPEAAAAPPRPARARHPGPGLTAHRPQPA